MRHLLSILLLSLKISHNIILKTSNSFLFFLTVNPSAPCKDSAFRISEINFNSNNYHRKMFKLISLATEILQINLERLKVQHDDGAERLFNCLKSIEAGSNKISTWSLSTLGGSILAILSTDYNAPKQPLFRLVYLLFYPGMDLSWDSIF